jgi:hypothetical protein
MKIPSASEEAIAFLQVENYQQLYLMDCYITQIAKRIILILMMVPYNIKTMTQFRWVLLLLKVQ